MQHRARATLYWPGIDADVVEYVRRCKTCTQHKATQHIQPVIPRDVPEAPWQDLAADFFNFKGKEYLLIADTLSKYPFNFRMTTKTADTFIQKLTQLFSQYGNPKGLTTDNGPPFSSEPFAQFMRNQRVEHITSSPHYPQSNGFIERQVKTMKTSLATAITSGKTLDDVLLSLKSTQISPNLPSPREILHNLTEECPGQPSHPVDCEQVRNYLLDKKATQKEYHDKSHNAKPFIRTGTRTKSSLPQPQRRKPIHQRHHHHQGSYTQKLLHRVPRQDILPYTPTHMHHQHTEPCFTRPIDKKLYKSHKTISKVITTVINMFHKTIIIAIEFLFCKTISKDTETNNQKSSLQDHHNHQIPWINCYSI